MNVLRAFLKERRKVISLYAGTAGVFFVILYLYNIRMDALKYAFLLSFAWFLSLEIVEFLQYKKSYHWLAENDVSIVSDLSLLPDPVSILEEEYQKILKSLYEQKVELESIWRISKQEMVDYYGMWVHQIKTPIAAMHVMLQSDSLQYDEEDAALADFVREMKLELFKIEQYVEMVLTYLRMEDMSSDMVFEQHSLDDIIKQAVRKYSQMFILKKIKLNYEPVNERVLTDEKWLVFVLEQILSNALKYTLPREMGNLCISIYMSQYKGRKMLVIEDTGIGIQPEDIPRVFEKGFTGYNGRSDKKSTGIGLYLCKKIMDRLQHRIWIESEVNHGTKVYLGLERDTLRTE